TNEKWSDPFDPDGSIKIIGGTLGVSEDNLSPFISISPNPFIHNIKIETNLGFVKVRIYDSTGKLLNETGVNKQGTLNLSRSAPGLYFVKMEDSYGRFYTKKILKQ
nr:T9SS type A sorting domain-containing protein [Bacteroidota bacterium]